MRSIFFTTALLSAVAAGLAFGVGNAMSATAAARNSAAVTVTAQNDSVSAPPTVTTQR